MAKGVNHGMCGRFCVKEAVGPDAAVATPRVQDEHGVVDFSLREDFNIEVGCEGWFRGLAT